MFYETAYYFHVMLQSNWNILTCMQSARIIQKPTFYYSFIPGISTAPLQVHYYSPRILCRSFTAKRHMQLRMKDLPKVPTWRPERDSNQRPFGRKATSSPMRYHAPSTFIVGVYFTLIIEEVLLHVGLTDVVSLSEVN